MAEKPETEAMVREKLASLKKMWEELESSTQTKAKCLFDANKAELFTQSCADLDKWLAGLDAQLLSDDYGKDLTSVNIMLKKQQVAPRHLANIFPRLRFGPRRGRRERVTFTRFLRLPSLLAHRLSRPAFSSTLMASPRLPRDTTVDRFQHVGHFGARGKWCAALTMD